jgi:hypothetical protein
MPDKNQFQILNTQRFLRKSAQKLGTVFKNFDVFIKATNIFTRFYKIGLLG